MSVSALWRPLMWSLSAHHSRPQYELWPTLAFHNSSNFLWRLLHSHLTCHLWVSGKIWRLFVFNWFSSIFNSSSHPLIQSHSNLTHWSLVSLSLRWCENSVKWQLMRLQQQHRAYKGDKNISGRETWLTWDVCSLLRSKDVKRMVSGILLAQRNGITHISFDILWCDVLLWISLFSKFQLNWKIFDLEFHLNHIITMLAQVKGVNKIEKIEYC